MLKRYQILLNDWIGEHIAKISEKYDISMSEVVRILLCLQIPKMISQSYPKHKVIMSDKKFVMTIKKSVLQKDERANLHKQLSDLYYEARKAIEFWDGEETKRKK